MSKLLNPSCLKCKRPFTADLPDWAATALCDRCHSDVLTYIVKATSTRQASHRVTASRRLYGRAARVPTTRTRPDACEADTDPHAADRATLASAAVIASLLGEVAFFDGQRPEEDTISESVRRGELEAAARFKADASAPGFDG